MHVPGTAKRLDVWMRGATDFYRYVGVSNFEETPLYYTFDYEIRHTFNVLPTIVDKWSACLSKQDVIGLQYQLD